ncbi:MAG: YceI family protein [Flavobacteriales bacterium]|nr:YceI family protein [Flavobacteriales bacterium]MBP9079568.1 YceI family protein [Flavobacteriales bacterium]
MNSVTTTTSVKWSIDPAHSEIQFKVKHMMISTVTGSFGKFTADIEADSDDLSQAQIHFQAEVDSISTGNTNRDNHLKSAEFFSGGEHPRITFVSTGSKAVDGDGSWTLYGDLTMNGTTRPVTLDVEWGGVVKDPYGNTKAGVSIHGRINRKDWGINWNTAMEAGGLMVSDEVRIACEVQLVKQG